jgi:hypothetical protein
LILAASNDQDVAPSRPVPGLVARPCCRLVHLLISFQECYAFVHPSLLAHTPLCRTQHLVAHLPRVPTCWQWELPAHTAVKDESVHTATCLRTLQVKANGFSIAEAHEAVIGQSADSAYAKRIAPIVNPVGHKSVAGTAIVVDRYGKARSTYRPHSALQRGLAIHKRGYALPQGIEGCLRTAG